MIPRDVVLLIVRFAFARLNSLYDRKFIAEIDIFTTSHCNFCNVNIKGCAIGLRDLKTFLHLAESRHFAAARAMHVSPSTLSRQIQRTEDDLGQPLFVRDNRTVTLTEAGEELRVFASKRCCSINSCATIDQQGPSLSGELHIFCSVTAAYSHLPPILDRFRAEHPSVEIKLTTGDAADAMERSSLAKRIWRLPGNRRLCPAQWRFRCWRIWQ